MHLVSIVHALGEVLTHEYHGGALRHHQSQHHVAHLALPQGVHPSVISLPLMPTVPAEVVIGPIPVLLPIGIIVLAVVGNQVIQGEAIMGNDEVGAMVRLPAVSGKSHIPSLSPTSHDSSRFD